MFLDNTMSESFDAAFSHAIHPSPTPSTPPKTPDIRILTGWDLVLRHVMREERTLEKMISTYTDGEIPYQVLKQFAFFLQALKVAAECKPKTLSALDATRIICYEIFNLSKNHGLPSDGASVAISEARRATSKIGQAFIALDYDSSMVDPCDLAEVILSEHNRRSEKTTPSEKKRLVKLEEDEAEAAKWLKRFQVKLVAGGYGRIPHRIQQALGGQWNWTPLDGSEAPESLLRDVDLLIVTRYVKHKFSIPLADAARARNIKIVKFDGTNFRQLLKTVLKHR
jgi:hypothetical protein